MILKWTLKKRDESIWTWTHVIQGRDKWWGVVCKVLILLVLQLRTNVWLAKKKKSSPTYEFVPSSMELVCYVTIEVGHVPLQGDVARFAWWGLMCVCVCVCACVCTDRNHPASTDRQNIKFLSQCQIMACRCDMCVWKIQTDLGNHNNTAVSNQRSIAGVVLYTIYACSQTSRLQTVLVNTAVQQELRGTFPLVSEQNGLDIYIHTLMVASYRVRHLTLSILKVG